MHALLVVIYWFGLQSLAVAAAEDVSEIWIAKMVHRECVVAHNANARVSNLACAITSYKGRTQWTVYRFGKSCPLQL